MGFRVTAAEDQGVTLFDANGNPIGSVLDGVGHRLAVDARITAVDPTSAGAGRGAVQQMRWEQFAQQGGGAEIVIPSASFVTGYEVTEESVFYEVLFKLDSEDVILQLEVDGVDLFNLGGFNLKDAKDKLKLDKNKHHHGLSISHVDSKRWVILPPDPLHVVASLKLKFRAVSGSKKLKRGLAVRRAL